MRGRAVALAVGLLGAGVARAELKQVPAPALGQACDDLELAPLAEAVAREEEILSGQPGPPLKFGARQVPREEYVARTLRPLRELLRRGDRARVCAALTKNHHWFRLGPGDVRFTAYHLPTVKGSLKPDERYKYPLYKRPTDASRHSTAQILGGSLKPRRLELVWLADAYDALAVHVEGGAKVKLPDGQIFTVGADGTNGLRYQNVTRLLAADGKLPPGAEPPSGRPGNPKARRYFSEHPEELELYWGRNAHFVFFKQVQDGPRGQLGRLTAQRSLAVDPAEVPLGALLWFRTQKPSVQKGEIVDWVPCERIGLAQDVGVAIKGPRSDVYFGEDTEALLAAQSMDQPGELYVLLSK